MTSEVFEVEVQPPSSEVSLQRQTSSNVSLAWLFDRANAAVAVNNHHNNNKNVNNNKKGNKNRKVSMNDRLMLAGECNKLAKQNCHCLSAVSCFCFVTPAVWHADQTAIATALGA